MSLHHPRAVVFDLFGTLVPNFSAVEFRAVAEAMGASAGAPPEEFARVYNDTYDLRLAGSYRTTEENVAHVCRMLGIAPQPERVAEAARLRVELTRRSLLAPLPGAVETLIALRRRGLRLGLVSDCSMEVPLVWSETSFVPLLMEPVFSWEAGCRKPDPRLYALACRRLGVQPEQCLYVGDGSGRELSGAASAGMLPVLVRVVYDATGDTDRPEVETWRGLEIRTLPDLVGLLARLSHAEGGGGKAGVPRPRVEDRGAVG